MSYNQPTASMRFLFAFVTLLATTPCSADSAKAASGAKPAALHILSNSVLSEALKYAVDLRWAGDHSVYLALKRSGVVEYNLTDKSRPARQLIPGEKAAGGF